MARTGQDLSLILCQVCFKNHQRSKLVTERIIQQITNGLAQTVKRAGDFVGSYQDNQLAAVLPNTNLAGAKHVAREFLAWFAAKKKNLPRFDRLQNVTLSLGVATTIPDHQNSYDILFQTAQRALLEAQTDEDNQIKTPR
jgi:diguanylate cyclase (GGDEF)-like protein